MAPSKKLKKPLSEVYNKQHDEEDWGSSLSTMRKRKLFDMLGSQWRKEEIEMFYAAYRRYGKDWRKVATLIWNRSQDEVAALYRINKAYLSLHDGAATAAGLVAMMTDQYNVMEGIDGNQQSNNLRKTSIKTSIKKQCETSKGSFGCHQDHSLTTSSRDGCISFLRQRNSGDILSGIHAVGKRTPRILVEYLTNSDYVASSDKQANLTADASNVKDVYAAPELVKASQVSGSSKILGVPAGSTSRMKSSVHSGKEKHAERQMVNALVGMDNNSSEGGLVSMKVGNSLSNVLSEPLKSENDGEIDAQQKAKDLHGSMPVGRDLQKSQIDDVWTASEGLDMRTIKDKFGAVLDGEATCSYPVPGTSRDQLILTDERAALEALQTLTELSSNILVPTSPAKSEQKDVDSTSKSNMPRSSSDGKYENATDTFKGKGGYSTVVGFDAVSRGHSMEEKARPPGQADFCQSSAQQTLQANCYMRKRKRKFSADKVGVGETKLSSVSRIALSEQSQSNQTPVLSSLNTDPQITVIDVCKSATKISTATNPAIPARSNRRKISLQKAMTARKFKSAEIVGDDCTSLHLHSFNNEFNELKKNLSHCMSSLFVRRWCEFEWFYSAIDYPWFFSGDYEQYLNHAGLHAIQKFNRVEWSIIRSSLGRPRRLSNQFLLQEREKLQSHRKSARAYYAETCDGLREGFPSNLARPLFVGQHVIARHPTTREIHDGSVLAVDHDQYLIKFNCSVLGTEHVMDTDCMRVNPVKDMLEDLIKKYAMTDKSSKCLADANPDGHITEKGNPENLAAVEHVDIGDDKVSLCKTAMLEKALYSCCSMSTPVQARQDEFVALSELTCAIDKKEVWLKEFWPMNQEVPLVKDSDDRQKRYEMVLLQLKDANEQVDSALSHLRKCNTSNSNCVTPYLWSTGNKKSTTCHCSSICSNLSKHSVHAVEIVEGSTSKARTMVDAAMQAISFLEGEYALLTIVEAISSVDNQNTKANFPCERKGCTTYSGYEKLLRSKPARTSNAVSPTLHIPSDATEAHTLSELISDCVAAFLMIQACGERRLPPSAVAKVLESAVARLQPRCSPNLPIYREIESFMHIIKNQMLAFVPTPIPPCNS